MIRRRRPISFAEAVVGLSASASSYGFPEHVRVLPVVMAELKFRQVERQVLAADIVVGADDSALQERPKRVQILGVDHPGNVLASGVVNGVVRIYSVQALIAYVLIGCDKRDLVADSFGHEPFERFTAEILNHAANYIALATDRPDDASFAGTEAASATVLAFVAVLVLLFAADKGFIDLDNAHEFSELRITHPSPQAMAHVPSRRIRGANLTLNLHGADALLAVQHRVQHFKPRCERVLGVLEDRSRRDREAVGVSASAFEIRAFPVPRHSDLVNRFGLAASRASDSLRPAPFLEELTA